MVELSITVTGAEPLIHALGGLEAAASDLRPAWEQVAPLVPQMVAETFAAEGPGWAPLAPAYAAWKQRHYPGKPILVRTEAGKKAATSMAGWSVASQPQQLVMTYHGPPYMAAHQSGVGRLPKRDWLRALPAYTEKMTAAVEQHLRDEAARLGLTP
jgi:hypothetical protein